MESGEYMSIEDMNYLDRIGYPPTKWAIVRKTIGEWVIRNRKKGNEKTIKVWA